MTGRLVMIYSLFGSLACAGCQTDALVGRSAERGAPVTALESVEIARQSEMSLAEATEVDLVEQLIYYRTAYAQTLRHLREYYLENGYAEKARWASGELADVERIRPYHYLIDSEIPRLDLSPSDQIAEADALFEKAVRVAREAGHGTPALYNREKMTEALRMFKQVVREYPTSDKIDDAAHYCGELYKEYFPGSEVIAVEWYQRAWEWDPQTPHPARFQAALVHDYRLHNRKRALELYHASLAAETDRSNRRFAVERIKQLTEVGTLEGMRTAPVAGRRGKDDSGEAQRVPEQSPPAAPD